MFSTECTGRCCNASVQNSCSYRSTWANVTDQVLFAVNGRLQWVRLQAPSWHFERRGAAGLGCSLCGLPGRTHMAGARAYDAEGAVFTL